MGMKLNMMEVLSLKNKYLNSIMREISFVIELIRQAVTFSSLVRPSAAMPVTC